MDEPVEGTVDCNICPLKMSCDMSVAGYYYWPKEDCPLWKKVFAEGKA